MSRPCHFTGSRGSTTIKKIIIISVVSFVFITGPTVRSHVTNLKNKQLVGHEEVFAESRCIGLEKLTPSITQ